MPNMRTGGTRSKLVLIFAYLMVYIIWGSTYLAIRYSIETIPPILSGGIRFLTAGLILTVLRIISTGRKPALSGWKYALGASILPFAVTYGLITTAEKTLPSSITALLIAMEPLWFCIIGWLFFKGTKPTRLHYTGIMVGFTGMLILVAGDPNADISLDSSYLLWMLAVILSNLTWVLGAFISRNPRIDGDPFMSSGMQMLCGGAIMMSAQAAISVCTGNYPEIGTLSLRSAVALGYLIIFGSLVAYTSFLWLMRVEPVNRVSTHAFVNPLVAVFLGWFLGGEAVHMNMLIAAPLIIISVILMIWQPKKS